MKAINITNISVRASGWRSKDVSVSWEHEGARYHFWADHKLKPLDDVLYKNPPLHIGQHGPGWFRTRKLKISKHNGVIASVLGYARTHNLVDKALLDEQEREEKRLANARQQHLDHVAQVIREHAFSTKRPIDNASNDLIIGHVNEAIQTIWRKLNGERV